MYILSKFQLGRSGTKNMFSWNPRHYWEIWPYELPLHHFPGQAELQQEAPPERPMQRPMPRFIHYAETPPTESRATDDQLELSFLKRCYLLGGTFVFFSGLQWLLFTLLIKHQGIFLLPGFVCVGVALISLIVLTFCRRLRQKKWFSFMFAWLFVQNAAIGVILLLPVRSLEHILVATLAAGSMLVLCYLLGARLPLYILPGEIAMAVIMVLFMIGSIVILTMFIVTDNPLYHAIYFSIIAATTIPMSLYHAQIVHSRRFWVPTEEYINCAVILFTHFDLFFLAFYYMFWIHQWV